MKKLFFSNYFEVDERLLAEKGYADISLLCDIPLFVDPFLIFGSKDEDYKALHEAINTYLLFLKNKAKIWEYDKGMINSWYKFSEVSNNWFGYCKFGNKGSGLGIEFANQLYYNLKTNISDFGNEEITKGTHIEKLCLIDSNIGSDNISDFIVNIIKKYFLDITEQFAKEYIKSNLCGNITVQRAYFDYTLEKWMPKLYYLPIYNNDFVILTPLNILTKDTSWINNDNMLKSLNLVIEKVPNEQLKFDINNYLATLYKKDMTKQEELDAKKETLKKYPILIDYYISLKELEVYEAMESSIKKSLYIDDTILNISNQLIEKLNAFGWYSKRINSYEETLERVEYLKDCIENKDGYRLFYDQNKNVIKTESDLQLLFRFVCFGTTSDVNREVNNGRGPVDYKLSISNYDKSLLEFKLASSTKLKQNLQKQVEVYQKANNTNKSIKAIIYFSDKEKQKLDKILNDLKLNNKENIIKIDARNNKISASNVK